MADHRRWNEEARVFKTGRALKSDANNSVILNHRPAAVSGIDRGIRLHGEKLSIPDVRIGLDFNAGNNAACIGNLFATSRITIRHDRGTHFWKIAQFQFIKPVEKAAVLDR